jgi:hypothetical protein
VGQFQLDSGSPGGAFGLALQTAGNQIRLAAVDDDTNALQIFTLDPAAQSGSVQGQTSPMPGQPSRSTPMSSSGMQSGSGGLTAVIDQVFQGLNAALASVESQLLALDPQLAGAVQMFNMELEALETGIAGHPIGGL